MLPPPPTLHMSSHPLVRHKMSILRNKESSHKLVRELISEISTIVGIEATSSLNVISTSKLSSPIGEYQGEEINDKIAFIPILRSGIGMTDALLNLYPRAHVFHLGLFREKVSLQPIEYYNKLPSDVQDGTNLRCFILDPMIATGGTAIAAVNILKDWGAKSISFVCICASLTGLKSLYEAHPDVHVWAGDVDDTLTSHAYILPGIGDAGDRIFSTEFKH